MKGLTNSILLTAAFAAGLAAQTGASENEPVGAPLRLVPPGSLPPKPVDRSGAPPAGPTLRTHQRRKVDAFSHDGEQVAIQGYDVVSYLDRRAEKGRKEYSTEYGGATWHFATPENRDAFRRDPERFLPQYGGHCAFSVSLGSPARADPRIFVVDRGKLYLFFDPAVRLVWQQDPERAVAEANERWPELHR